MLISKIDEENKILYVSIPLTNSTGKSRIKQRSYFNEYGVPIPTRQVPINQSCYVEWQIGYDISIKDKKLNNTSLKNISFLGANGKEKVLYELSEYIYYFYNWKIILKKDLANILSFIDEIPENQLIDKNEKYVIKRTHPIENEILGKKFLYSKVEYPVLIYRFNDNYEIMTEIITKEKQKAVGVQPMLYLCFPITELKTERPIIGRSVEKKEMGKFIINKDNISIFIEILKIFSILSLNHRIDIKKIICRILNI